MNIPRMMSIAELREARRKEANPSVRERSEKLRTSVKSAYGKEAELAEGYRTASRQKSIFCLKGIKGIFAGADFPLDEVITIGREKGKANIVFPADTPGISRQHCSIWVDADGTVMLQDHNSSQGTYFGDGSELAANKLYRLRVGETFYLASPKQTFQIVRRKG